jgi:translation initiation factor 1
MAKAPKRIPLGGSGAIGTSLGEALGRSGLNVAAPGSAPPPAEPAIEAGAVDLFRCGKLVLRRECKGRQGKTATVLSGLAPALGPDERQQLIRQLRRALGCGAAADGETIVLQGDLGERAAAWLIERGARRVVVAR